MFQSKQKHTSGFWASMDLLLVFIFLVLLGMPVLNYSYFVSMQKSEWVHSQEHLSSALLEAENIYMHGAVLRENPPGSRFVKTGYFDDTEFVLYLTNHQNSKYKYSLSEPNISRANQVCVSRTMVSGALPKKIYVCEQG